MDEKVKIESKRDLEKQPTNFQLFIRSNWFIYLISLIIATGISCVLILAVASKHIIVTPLTGFFIISSFSILISFFIFVILGVIIRGKR